MKVPRELPKLLGTLQQMHPYVAVCIVHCPVKSSQDQSFAPHIVDVQPFNGEVCRTLVLKVDPTFFVSSDFKVVDVDAVAVCKYTHRAKAIVLPFSHRIIGRHRRIDRYHHVRRIEDGFLLCRIFFSTIFFAV